MEFCEAKKCPFLDCKHHKNRAPNGFAYTAVPMDDTCDRYKDYQIREKEKKDRIRRMTLGDAYIIFQNIDSPDFSDEEKGNAVWKIVNMETHMGVTKAMMLKVIRWLLGLSFKLPEEKP